MRDIMRSGRQRLPWVFMLFVLGGYIAAVAAVTAKSPIVGTCLFGFPLLVFWTFYRSDLFLILFFLTQPFDKLGKLFPAETSYLGILTVPKILLLLLILAWIARVLISKDKKIVELGTRDPVFLVLLGFVLASILSVSNADNMTVGIFYLVRRLTLFLLFFFLINVIRDEQLLDRILLVSLIGFVGVALIGVYEFVTGEGILVTLWGEGVGKAKELAYIVGREGVRIRGTTGDPDFHGVAMLLPMIVAFMTAILSKSRICKALMIVLCGLFVFNVLATGSRGTALSVASAVLVFFLFSRLRHRFLVIGLVLTVLGGLYVFSKMETTQLPAERLIGESGLKSIQYRAGWTKMAFDMIVDHPLIGVGTGNFVAVYQRYWDSRVPRDPKWPHNSFLQVWVENGFLASLLYMAAYVIAARRLYLICRKSQSRTLRIKALAFFATLFGYFLFAITSNVLENEYYWSLLAFSVAVSVIERQRQGT